VPLDVGGSEERPLHLPVGGIDVEDEVDELPEQGRLVLLTHQLVLAEVGAGEKSQDSCNGEIPWSNQPLCNGRCQESLPELFDGGRFYQLVLDRQQLRQLRPGGRSVSEADIGGQEELDGDRQRAWVVQLYPALGGDTGVEAD